MVILIKELVRCKMINRKLEANLDKIYKPITLKVINILLLITIVIIVISAIKLMVFNIPPDITSWIFWLKFLYVAGFFTLYLPYILDKKDSECLHKIHTYIEYNEYVLVYSKYNNSIFSNRNRYKKVFVININEITDCYMKKNSIVINGCFRKVNINVKRPYVLFSDKVVFDFDVEKSFLDYFRFNLDKNVNQITIPDIFDDMNMIYNMLTRK